jgi:hypothetical protein
MRRLWRRKSQSGMKWVIPFLVVAAFCVFLILALRTSGQSIVETERNPNLNTVASPAPVTVDANPDTPVPFGYKCVWFAVKTTNSVEVLETVGFKSAIRCNWMSGIKAAYHEQVFVSPPVQGWTLIVGQDLPTLDDPARVKQTENLLTKLSAKFEEAHHYATHRVAEYHCWAKASNGKIVREYAYLGESGETVRNMGEKTEGEKAAGIGNAATYVPDEETVMKVAEKWSLNPSTLNQQSAAPATGWLGHL